MPAAAGGCLRVRCRRGRCRSCPRPLRAARSGAERSGGGRRVSPAGSAAGDAAPGRPGRGAEPPSGRQGESGPLPLPGRYVHGRKPRKSPLPSSPSTWVPGRARSSCRGAQPSRVLPPPPGGETFRRVRGSSQINHGAALLYQLDFSGTDGIKISSAFWGARMHGTSARGEVRLGMWELRALTGASWVSGASHVVPARCFLPGKAAGLVLLSPI